MANLSFQKHKLLFLFRNCYRKYISFTQFKQFSPSSTTVNENPHLKISSFIQFKHFSPSSTTVNENPHLKISPFIHFRHFSPFPATVNENQHSKISSFTHFRHFSQASTTVNENQHPKISSFTRFRHFSQSPTTPNDNQHPKISSFMVDYLINSCGFSRDKALTLSKNLNHIDSPKKPDSVLLFLKENGFNDTHIRTLITKSPRLLTVGVEKNLKPKIRFLQDLGLVELILKSPEILSTSMDKHLVPCIRFLRKFLLSEKNIIKALTRYGWLYFCNVEKTLIPNVLFLQKCGVSNETISKFILNKNRIVTQNPSYLQEVVKRVEELGITHDSGFFGRAVYVIIGVRRTAMETKFELFKSFGWSEEDIVSAFHRFPPYIGLSESSIRKKMKYFLKDLKIESSYISLYPQLLGYSLEKRIIPQQIVMHNLKLNKLMNCKCSLYSIVSMSEKKFFEKFVLPWKDKAPDVYEVYVRTVGGSGSRKC